MKSIVLAVILGFTPSVFAKKQIQLSDNNVITISGPIRSSMVSAVFEESRKLDSESAKQDPVYVFLNTPGGSIQAGLELIEGLQQMNRPVHTITLFSASMGFQIVQALGERNVLQNGVMMSHEAYGGFEGAFSHGKSQLDAIYGLWLRRIEELDKITVSRTKGKQTLDSYRKAYSKDLWLTGIQSVEDGYADSVVGVRCDVSLNGTRTETVMFFGFQLLVRWSKCPLNTYPLSVEPVVNTNKGVMELSSFLSQGGATGFKRDPLDDYGIQEIPELYTEEKVDIVKMKKTAEEYKEQKIKEISSRQPIRY